MQPIFDWLDRHPARFLSGLAVITALLTIPMVTMAPTESASTEPDGDVFAARDQIDERFVSSIFPVFLIADAPDGNVVDASSLRDLRTVSETLRNDPALGPNLFSYFDTDTETDVDGLLTIADLTDAALDGTIATAPDDVVEATASGIIDEVGPDTLTLSTSAVRGDDGLWTVPALTVLTLSDNARLGFGNLATNLGGGTEAEEYAREIQEVLQQAGTLDVYGVAIDVNLTSQEQGALAGPFIGLTVLAVLLVVGVVFRSYWVLATVGVALGALMIWLKGLTNLLGFDDDLVLSLIVPIAMISFGVDFAFHSVGRYREERGAGTAPRRAYVVGLTAVSGALVLALTSDVAAFLSNVTSGIESIVNFGLGAAIALAAAFLLLGVATPLVVSIIDSRLGSPPGGRRHTAVRIAASVGAGSLVMASVLLMVFVAPAVGIGIFAVTVLVTLIGPYLIRARLGDAAPVEVTVHTAGSDRFGAAIGGFVASLARRPGIVIPVALAVTGVAAYFAVGVPAEFDVEDFFSSDSDFVVALDLLDEHVGDRGGEPAQIYIEADLLDPTQVAAIAGTVADITALDTGVLARNDDGVVVEGGVVSVLDAVWANPTARTLISERTGVTLTDDDGDGVPDTSDQLAAVYEVTAAVGVPFDATRLALTPDDVATAMDVSTEPHATVISMGLVNSRSQTSIQEAERDLTPIVDSLGDELDATVQLTGSPFVREASLAATNRALQISLPVAVILCLLIAGVFLRSFRYGVVSVLPVLMTVAWLYAFMNIAGYAINIVTATIAAVSIGIGIDFAIHFIVRFREELARLGKRQDAVRAAAEGTGTALVASAVSSSVGFGILAFAPMPLFAAYGLLTAVMIALALVATLMVLPAILVLITSDSEVEAVDDPDRVMATV